MLDYVLHGNYELVYVTSLSSHRWSPFFLFSLVTLLGADSLSSEFIDRVFNTSRDSGMKLGGSLFHFEPAVTGRWCKIDDG